MSSMNVSLSIPDDVLVEINSFPLNLSINDNLQLSLAIGMFASKQISLAKSAELAKKNLSEFMGILKSLNIPSATYSSDMLDEDFELVTRG